MAIIHIDQRVRREISGYIREFDAKAVVQEFNNTDEFDKFYFTSLVINKINEEDIKEEEKDPRTIPQKLDLILVDNGSVKSKKIKEWTTKAAVLLKQANLWPEENRPKFIALAYEEQVKDKEVFAHPFIDDLITSPLDRLIILQKIELIINLPKNVSPTYLFVQETDEDIEVAKQVKLVQVSDLTVTIENPLPIRKGSLAHIRFRMSGEDGFTGFHGRVIKSEPIDMEKSSYNVTFAMSVFNKNVLKKLRNFVTQDVTYKLLVDSDNKNFEYNPDNIFLTEDEKSLKTIAIIDPDFQFGKHISENIQKELNNVRIVFDTSWANFYQNHLADYENEIPACTEADMFAKEVVFYVSRDDLKFQKLETQSDNPEDEILGWKVSDLFSSEESWKKIYFAEHAHARITDMHNSLALRKRISQNVALQGPDQMQRTFGVVMEVNPSEKNLKITLGLPDHGMMKSKEAPILSLDAVFIHEALVATNSHNFINNLKKQLKVKNLKTQAAGPACFLITENENIEAQRKLLNGGYTAVFTKPLDTRQILHWLSASINSPFTIYTNENIGQREVKLNAKIATEAQLTALSEFGASVSMPSKLKIGSIIYIFGSIYKNAPSGNMCCRIYATSENDLKKGEYINHGIYFGLNESFLKLTRNYIRETYAEKKSKN